MERFFVLGGKRRAILSCTKKHVKLTLADCAFSVILESEMSAPTLSPAILVQTQEEERYRLARALQNGPGQLLANAALEIETCLRLMENEPEAAREGLRALLAELSAGLSDLRRLVRELQPPLLNDLGLYASLQKAAGDFSAQTGIPVAFTGWERLNERMPASMEISIFRIVHEALENVAEHSGATHAQINLEQTPTQMIVTVEDNGRGFDLTTYGIANPDRRFGLLAMRDRAEFLAGQLHVFSEPGGGTRVVLDVPLPQTAS